MSDKREIHPLIKKLKVKKLTKKEIDEIRIKAYVYTY